jgi:acyl-CoA synthetase (AMP-forming)/AMP-acid ligase II
LARRDLGPRVTAYGHGHRVGVLLENRPDFFLHWFALNALGVSLVPLNPDLRAAELEYLIGHSEMVAALASPSRHSDLSAAAKAIGRSIAVFGPSDQIAPLAAPPSKAGSPDRNSECALLYTSGTTGRPKGCVLPNEYRTGLPLSWERRFSVQSQRTCNSLRVPIARRCI